MSLDDHIHILVYLFIYSNVVGTDNNSNLKVVEVGLEKISPCSVGLQFFVDVNNTSKFDYNVEMEPDQCCLDVDGSEDCDVLAVAGGYSGVMPAGQTTTARLVAPIIDPYERKGYCIVFLDSKGHKKRHVMRDVVKIIFDTRLRHNKLDQIEIPEGVTPCKHPDEDPLNECQPVDCEVFYNGVRSFYNVRKKRCTQIPSCVSKNSDMPDTIYNPVTNDCVNKPITRSDVDKLKDWANLRIAKDIMIIKSVKDPNDDVTEKVKPIAHVTQELKSCPKNGDHVVCLNGTYNSAITYIFKNKCGVYFLAMIIVLQCCLICTMVCCKKCKYKRKDKGIESRYYCNNLHDASMTTPLISTTHNETETTYQCTDSSNLDKKIQWYKSCQKDNVKVSLSDDILSKCLNRRNWDRKIVKSEAIDIPARIRESISRENSRDGSKQKFEAHFVSTKKQGEQNIVFENEMESRLTRNAEKKARPIKSIVKKTDNKKSSSFPKKDDSDREVPSYNYMGRDREMREQSDFGFSEREIKCHSYHYRDETDSSRKHSNTCSDLQKSSQKPELEKQFRERQKKSSVTTTSVENDQASAQASFSNDSIDDFLSERGELFLAGDTMSKYSYSNDSIAKSSGISSKTSKNNLMKSVLSYLKKGKKQAPSSEPGGKAQDKDKIHLELLHMSRVSTTSSSNNDECLKSIMKSVKDSRTSL